MKTALSDTEARRKQVLKNSAGTQTCYMGKQQLKSICNNFHKYLKTRFFNHIVKLFRKKCFLCVNESQTKKSQTTELEKRLAVPKI